MFGFWLLNLLKKENKQQRTYKKINVLFQWIHNLFETIIIDTKKTNNIKQPKKNKQKRKQMAYGCVNLQFTLTQLIIDTITCAITITASMPPTDIIAMCIHVTLLFCVGFVKIVFSICSFIAFSEKNFY